MQNSRWNHIASFDDADVLEIIRVDVKPLEESDMIERLA